MRETDREANRDARKVDIIITTFEIRFLYSHSSITVHKFYVVFCAL